MSNRARGKLLVANWKMHFLRAPALDYLKVFKERVRTITKTEIVLAPPFTLLETVGRAIRDSQIKLAAQDLFYERAGAFTGEISPAMLQDLDCAYVIVGHSERRQLFGERDEIVNKKLHAALESDLSPILCVGESLTERQAAKTESVLETQVKIALQHNVASAKLVVAYEPVWAIGTGVNAAPAQAQASAHFIRETLRSLLGAEIAQSVRILYGGSVKVSNLESFLQEPDIDGALVGGASLDPAAFAEMAQQAERSAST